MSDFQICILRQNQSKSLILPIKMTEIAYNISLLYISQALFTNTVLIAWVAQVVENIMLQNIYFLHFLQHCKNISPKLEVVQCWSCDKRHFFVIIISYTTDTRPPLDSIFVNKLVNKCYLYIFLVFKTEKQTNIMKLLFSNLNL